MTGLYRIGEFDIEAATRRLRRSDGQMLHLANRPFQVLLHLVGNRHRLVTRSELLEQFWDGRDVYEDALTRCVSTIRKALDDTGRAAEYVETRWAEGYRFIGPCREIDTARPARRGNSVPRLSMRSGRCHHTYAPTRTPALIERLIRRGNAYLCRSGNRNYRYALDMFRQASEIDPEDARAQGGRAAGHALLYLHEEPTEDRRAAATAILRSALEIDPMHSEVQLARAQVAVMCADHAEADAAFRQAELLQPATFYIWYYHGRGCAEQADHDGALSNYMRAREADPFDYQALALAEQSFRRLGLYADADRAARDCTTAAERILRRYPDDVRALSLGACVLPQLGRKAEAVGWSERAVALEPDEPFVNFNAACVYIALRDYDRAIHYLGRVQMSAAGNYNWILQDPCVDPVRSHPRFAAVLGSQATA